MGGRDNDLDLFLSRHSAWIAVRIADAKGSTPRENGALMIVTPDALWGTIGGGHLEFAAIDKARQMLRNSAMAQKLDVTLGPDTGQCCGGRVTLSLKTGTSELGAALVAAQPKLMKVFIFGAGHVGRALAQSISLLPFEVELVDERRIELEKVEAPVRMRLSAVPEMVVQSAPAGSVFVIMTHDHALDFLIAREALQRADAAYVGMIGSQTKKAVFASWLKENGGEPESISYLACPMGDKTVDDKRPEVIAALVTAEILVHSHRARVGGENHTGAEKRDTGVS